MKLAEINITLKCERNAFTDEELEEVLNSISCMNFKEFIKGNLEADIYPKHTLVDIEVKQ